MLFCVGGREGGRGREKEGGGRVGGLVLFVFCLGLGVMHGRKGEGYHGIYITTYSPAP